MLHTLALITMPTLHFIKIKADIDYNKTKAHWNAKFCEVVLTCQVVFKTAEMAEW